MKSLQMLQFIKSYRSMSKEDRAKAYAKFSDKLAEQFAKEVGLSTKKRGELDKIMNSLK